MNYFPFTSNHLEHDKAVRFVTFVALIVNLLLSAIKFYVGFVDGSQALVADGIHSLSDMVSDVVIIWGSYYWTKPADKHHQYGHGRIETLVSIFIGILLAAAGVGIVNEAVASYSQGIKQTPGVLAIMAALVSIVANELLFRWTYAYGERIKSPALMANAWHHRTDAFSSIPALIAVASIMIFPSWVFLDRIGAVIVSIFIFYAAYQIINGGVKELIDASAPAEICKEIEKVACGVVGVRQVHGLRTRFTGANLYVDLHVLVDGQISVTKGHDIAEEVKGNLLAAEMDIVDIVVHIEPDE